MVEVDGGDLSDIYDQLNDEDEDSVAVAENISGRIDAVEDVSDTLFDEWEAELSDYSSTSLRRDSERKL